MLDLWAVYFSGFSNVGDMGPPGVRRAGVGGGDFEEKWAGGGVRWAGAGAILIMRGVPEKGKNMGGGREEKNWAGGVGGLDHSASMS